jgi:murein DD-endopeptidase MepM/ murein hydrolase activator NlpD
VIPRAAAPGDEARREQVRQAARQLEVLVLKHLVAASGAFKGGNAAGAAVREDLFATALADALVRGGGIGLASQVERSVTGEAAPAPAAAPRPSLAAEAPARLTSGFGLRADPFTGLPAMHRGVDLAAAEGTDVGAALDGVVRAAGVRAGYGLAVEVDHGNGLSTLYAHASELLVRDGDRVTRGQPIARVGHTGRATGPHLHLEVRQAGRQLDPARALKIYGVRVDTTVGSGSGGQS